MKTKWIEQKIDYDGSQLRSLYAYLDHSVLGDSIISWEGACSVSFDHMVDGEDLLAQSKIESKHMLHFIVEKFNVELFSAVALQRLLAEIIIAELRKRSPENQFVQKLQRKGDDIYSDNKKLNISIATQSPSSSLIHFGVNIKNEGTPVPTLCLEDCDIKSVEFGKSILDLFAEEVEGMERATQKVKWVK